jgi:hypothetical protein
VVQKFSAIIGLVVAMTTVSTLFEGYSILGANAQSSSSSVKPEVLYNDDKPGLCKLVQEGKTPSTCDSFKVLKQGDVHYFTYYFGGSPISFVSVLLKSEGKIDTFIVGEMYGNKKILALKKPGFCIRSTKFSMIVTCSVNDYKIDYQKDGGW